MENTSMGFNESNNLSILDSSEESLSTSLLLMSSSQIFSLHGLHFGVTAF